MTAERRKKGIRMARPKLSICIPTYNRARLLERTLGQIATVTLPFSYEVVVSDNASEDDTANVVAAHQRNGMPLTYFRQQTTLGQPQHQASVLRRGTGEYVIYLADDDMLIWENVVSAVQCMDRLPSVVACFSPVEHYDEPNDVIMELSHKSDAIHVFGKEQLLELIDFLIFGGVRPEIAVYRSSMMQHCLIDRKFGHMGYADLAHFICCGHVIFMPSPLYRFFVYNTLGESGHFGIDWVKTGWNREKGALQEFVHTTIKRSGYVPPAETMQHICRLLDVHEVNSMIVALGLWLNDGDYIKCFELVCRIDMALAQHNLSQTMFKSYGALKTKLRDGLQAGTVVAIAQAMRPRRIVVLAALGSAWERELRARGLSAEIEIAVAASPDALPTDDTRSVMVLTSDAATREALVAKGYPAGMVIDCAGLAQCYQIW